MSQEVTLETLRADVRKMDENLDESDEAFDAAVLLLAVAALGPPWTIARLASFTEIGERRVATYLRRLRANGVLRGRDKLAVNWFDEDGGFSFWFDEDGGFSFWLDVCMATGMLERGAQAARSETP